MQFFDSCILIDVLNGVSAAREAVEMGHGRSISVVVRAEVLTGVRDAADEQLCQILLSQFACFDATTQIADMAAALRRQYRLKTPDALILATSVVTQAPLFTRDANDFPLERPDIVIPYRLQ